MELITEARQSDLHRYFAEFEAAVKERSWRRVAEEVSKEIKGSPFLGEYLRHRHRIAFALRDISEFKDRHGHFGFPIEANEVYEACVLVALFSEISKKVSPKECRALTRRLMGALKNPPDMRGLIFELQILTHFARRGFEIQLPETGSAAAVDGLVQLGGECYEVECKAISGDKGRQIHRRDALEINHHIQRELKGLLQTIRVGLLVRITFSSRSPKGFDERRALAKTVRTSILVGGENRFEGYKVEVVQFDISRSPFADGMMPNKELLKAFLAGYGVVNRETMAMPGGSGVVTVTLESEVSDRFLEEVLSTASDAARRQLTGTRPGMLFLKFEDLTAEQLIEVGAEKGRPTALRVRASEFLDSHSARNVTSIGFLADGAVQRVDGGAVTRTGVNYHFLNERNEFAPLVARGRFFD